MRPKKLCDDDEKKEDWRVVVQKTLGISERDDVNGCLRGKQSSYGTPLSPIRYGVGSLPPLYRSKWINVSPIVSAWIDQ
jgi:hypothetical protein